MFSLTAKRILVTNVAGSLGSELAVELSALGAVVAGAHDNSAGASVAVPGSLQSLIGYAVGQPEDAARLIADTVAVLGGLDGVVIVPERQPIMPFVDQHEKDWDRALGANVAGLFYVAQAAARHMVAQGSGGRIVFVTGVASEMPFPEATMFGSTQAAINTIARVAAIELGQHGITVNALAPGWLETADRTLHFSGHEFEAVSAGGRSHVIAGIPVGRIGRVADLAHFCAFLLSDASGYVNGAYLPLDGAYAITKAAGNTPYPDGRLWLPYDSGYDPAKHDT